MIFVWKMESMEPISAKGDQQPILIIFKMPIGKFRNQQQDMVMTSVHPSTGNQSLILEWITKSAG